MKKSLRIAALCLGLTGMGAGVSSCDSDTVIQVLSIVAQMLQGESTSYKANSCSAAYYQMGDSGQMQQALTTTVSGMTATINCNSYTSTATISFNDVQLSNNISITNLSIVNLLYTANSAQTQVDFTVGDNSTINGTITINGTAYSASNLYLSKATATSGQFSFNGDIYFGDDNYAINYTFTASQVNQ